VTSNIVSGVLCGFTTPSSSSRRQRLSPEDDRLVAAALCTVRCCEMYGTWATTVQHVILRWHAHRPKKKKYIPYIYFEHLVSCNVSTVAWKKRLGWSRGSGYPSSRVQTRPKPSGFFRAKKFLSTPSIGREVNPWVPCRRFVACKRSLNWSGSRNIRQNFWLILAHIVPPFATRISRVVGGDLGASVGERGNV